MLVLAGINMAVFHLTAYRSIALWDRMLPPPRGPHCRRHLDHPVDGGDRPRALDRFLAAAGLTSLAPQG